MCQARGWPRGLDRLLIVSGPWGWLMVDSDVWVHGPQAWSVVDQIHLSSSPRFTVDRVQAEASGARLIPPLPHGGALADGEFVLPRAATAW